MKDVNVFVRDTGEFTETTASHSTAISIQVESLSVAAFANAKGKREKAG